MPKMKIATKPKVIEPIPEPIGTARFTGDQLREIADVMRPICRNGGNLPALAHIRIESENSRLTVAASNLDTIAIYRGPDIKPATGLAAKLLEARHERENGAFLAPFDSIRQISRAAASAVLTGFWTAGSERFTVRAEITLPNGQIVADSFDSLGISEFPLLPEQADLSPENTVTISESSLAAIRHAMEVSSDDSTRHVLQSVAFDGSQDGHHAIIATDARRLYQHNSQTFPFNEVRMLPKCPLTSPLVAPLSSPGWQMDLPPVATENGRVRISAGAWTFHIRCIEGMFPNYRQVIPVQDFKTTVILTDAARKDLLATMTKLPSWKSARNVGLVVSAGRCSIRLGNSSIDFPATVTGEDIAIFFNPEYLAHAFRQGFCHIDLIGPETPATFRAGAATLILMPIRVNV